MAAGFKIGEGFVEVTAQDRTSGGLAQITASIDRWIAGIERRIASGFAHAFDAGADAAERRIRLMEANISRQLDKLDGRNVKIEIDLKGVADLVVQLLALNQLVNKLDKRSVRITAYGHNSVNSLHNGLNRIQLGLVRVGAYVASFTSLLGPLSIGLALALDWCIKLGAALLTLSATLPALAASIGLVVGAAVMMGDGIKKAIEPVQKAFARTSQTISDMAYKAVRPLAQEFVKVNFPTINASLIRIGRSLTGIVTQVGHWLNSTAGQHAIRTVTEATEAAMSRLAPATSRVVIAFGNLVDRAGAPAIQGLGDLLTVIADRTTQWLNSLTREDVQGAIEHLKKTFFEIVDVVQKIVSVMQWIVGNVGGIRAASDALAAVGLTLAVIGGAWPAAIIAIITLALNHVDALTNGFKNLALWVEKTYERIANDPWVKKIVQDLKDLGGPIMDGVKEAFDKVGQSLDVFADKAAEWWPKIAPLVDKFLKDPKVKQGAEDIAKAVVALALTLGILGAAVAAVTATITALSVGAFVYLVGLIHEAKDKIADFATSAKDKIADFATSAKDAVVDFATSAKDAVVDFATSAKDAVVDFATSAKDKIADFATSVKDKVTDFATSAKDAISEFVDSAVEWFQALPERAETAINSLPTRVGNVIDRMATEGAYRVGEMIGTIVGFFIALPIRIADAIVSLPDKVATVFNSARTQAVALVTDMANTVAIWFTNMLIRAVNAINALPDRVSSIFNSARAQAVALVTDMANAVATWFANMLIRAVNAINALPARVSSIFNSARAQAVALVTNMANAVATWFANMLIRAINAINALPARVRAIFSSARAAAVAQARSLISQTVSVLSTLRGRITSAIGNLGSLLTNAGRSLISGFVSGIRSQIPSVSGVLNSITSKLPAWKGPEAEDAKILRPAGRSVIKGFMRGVDDQTPALAAQLGNLTSSIGALGAAIPAQRTADTANGGVTNNFAPGSIVLDASKIKDISDLLEMLDGIQPTARQYGARTSMGGVA